MHIFITGTDTNVGKTIVSSWLCLHLRYDYFKPIQTGSEATPIDSSIVKKLSRTNIHKESYIFQQLCSPHLAAKLANKKIYLNSIQLPNTKNLIIEGAGGLLTPINFDKHLFIIDLIKKFNIPTILVARHTLGTINHTLLSLEALRTRNIPVLGVIINGGEDQDNYKAIKKYGNTTILSVIPKLSKITKQQLFNLKLNNTLKKLCKKN